MPSAELTTTQAPRQPAADHQAPYSRSPQVVDDGRPVGFEALSQPQVAGRESSTRPPYHRRRGPATDAIAQWLRRALADAARAWALAAGVPPDLYHN